MICKLLFKGRVLHAAIIAGIVILLAACVTARSQETGNYTNMPASCVGVSTDLAGKPLSNCPTSNQKFVRATNEGWVRVCPQTDNDEATVQSCTYQTMVWQRWASVSNGGDRIDVCTISKASGSPSAGTGASCSTSGTGWSGMKQVPIYEVAVVPPLPPQSAFTVSPTSGNSPLNVVLSWNVPGMPSGTPCQAQSTASNGSQGPWNGPKSAVGNESISSLMISTRFTLTCVYSKDIAVVVSWNPPTKNTDGTPFTSCGGYTVSYGQNPQELSQAAGAACSVSSLLIQDYYFKEGQWYFAVKARAGDGNESDLSNIAGIQLVKPSGGTAPFSGSVDVTVNPKPLSPTDTTVEQVDAPQNSGQIVPPTDVEQKVLKRTRQQRDR